MGKITIRDINVYAHHGCFIEETKIGSEYKVDISIVGNFSTAEKSDNLKDTIDYVSVSDVVSREMEESSKLIEHVAERIVTQILFRWPVVDKVQVVIKKLAPPMNVYAGSVEYSLDRRR